MTRLTWTVLAALATLGGCAAPPLQTYTLGAPAIGTQGTSPTSTGPVLRLDRVVLPDYLDTTDIVVRDDDRIDRSASARWAERLSSGITALLRARLAQDRPGTLFTTQADAAGPADARLEITITRLDITQAGSGALEASWRVLPRDPHAPIVQRRGAFSATGPTRTDAGTVALTRRLVEALAAGIAQTL